MKQMTLIEVDGFLKGKCIPSDLNVNETNAEYLVRKFGELESKLETALRECRSAGITIDNLEAKCAALAAENAGIKSAIPESRDIEYDNDNMDDVSLAEDLGFNHAIERMRRQIPETPATDAFLAEVRAQGVEMLAKNHQSIVNALKGDSLFSGIPTCSYCFRSCIFRCRASQRRQPVRKINYQALRDAAEKATQGEWVAFISPGKYGVYAVHTPGDNHHGDIVDWPGFDGQKNAENNARYIAAFNPEVVQALLDELERNQQYIKSRDQENEDIALTVGKLRVELEAAKSKLNEQREYYEGVIADGSKRIAELEAREIKPAKGEVLVVVSGFTGCGKSAIAGEIEIAMKAIGVPVQWTNGDAEKRMTGADWLTAIEMYKPTVRIMEVNVPRAAGIRIKGE
ncbi:hypothetical protein LL13C18_16210 [Escherichia coli]